MVKLINMKELLPILKTIPVTDGLILAVLIAGIIITILSLFYNLDRYSTKNKFETVMVLIALMIMTYIASNVTIKIDLHHNNAIQNKEYEIIQNNKILHINSKSKYLKSKTFLIQFKNENVIQFQYNNSQYQIKKSEENIILRND